MTNWKEITLGEVVEIIDGDRGVNYPKNNEFFNDGFCLFLNTKNVPGTGFSFGEKMFISEDTDSKLRKGKLKRGDFVLTTRGTIGNFAYFSEAVPFENIRINSGMVILRVKEVLDRGFLNFYLKSYFFKEQTISLSSGTAQPQLPIKDLKYFQILLPSIEEQKEIAGVLSSLDDKIELLREENKTLEATAQAIFKEWFVNFNFPNAEGKPYKSSGGKMIDSELGEIPEGWRVGKLSEIAKVDWGNTALTKSSYIPSGKFLGVSAAGCDGRMNHKEYDFGAIVISAIGEYCGRLFFPMEDFTAIKNTLVVEERNSKTSYFVYFGLQIWKLERRGAAQSFLSKGDTEKMNIIIPAKNTLDDFKKFSDSVFQKIKNNNSQIQTLSTLRDTLLPKLIKGEIKVDRNF